MKKKNKPPCDCSYCKNYCENVNRHCWICLELSEFEPKLDLSKDLMNKPNERDMERMIKLIKKDYGEK